MRRFSDKISKTASQTHQWLRPAPTRCDDEAFFTTQKQKETNLDLRGVSSPTQTLHLGAWLQCDRGRLQPLPPFSDMEPLGLSQLFKRLLLLFENGNFKMN